MKSNILLFCVVFNLQIQSQWSTDPNVNNQICAASGDQFLPQTISDQSGGAIIVWEDFRNGSNYDIYSQRISSTGVVLWLLNGVAISAVSNDQTMPVIISDGNGGVIITWTDFRSGNYSDIYAQKINAEGVLQWTANGISVCNSTNSQFNPSLVSDGNGGAIITWQDDRNGVFSGNIYAQHINSSGLPSWESNGVVICSEVTYRAKNAIASDGLGGAIIAWTDERHSTALNQDRDVYAQRIDANGSVMWTADGIPVSSLTGFQGYPEIINNNLNEVIICWHDSRNGIDADIYSQRIINDGSLMWNTNGVALSTATDLQTFPVLTTDNAGGAIVAWQDYRSGAFDVYAQRIDVDGNVLWAPDGSPISAETNAQMSPDITSDLQGGAIITWRDYRDNGNQDIYAQRIDNNGIVQWTVNGIAVSVSTADQYTPAITSDGNGGAIITWWDYRNGTTSDIYAQQISYDGQLGVVTDADKKNFSPSLFSLEQNYPNPFNPSTKISWQLPVGSHQTLKVFDVLGNEIATLVNEEKPAGTYEVTFNPVSSIKNPASGIYFYQLKAGTYLETKKMILLK